MDKDPNNHFLTFPGNPCPHSRQGDPRVQVPHLHHEVLNRSLDMAPHPGLFLFLLVPRGYPQDPRRVPQGISTRCRRPPGLNLSPHKVPAQGCTLDAGVLIVPRLQGYPTQITHLDHGPLLDPLSQRGHLQDLPPNQTILCMAIRPSRLKGMYFKNFVGVYFSNVHKCLSFKLSKIRFKLIIIISSEFSILK